MEHIPHDHDPSAPQCGRAGVLRSEMAGQGEEIQQALAGMAVEAVAGVQHGHPLAAAIQIAGEGVGHAGAAVTHHQHVGAHGHVGAGGIEQALPFAQ